MNSQPADPNGTQGLTTAAMINGATYVQAGWNVANTAWSLASGDYPTHP